MTILCISPEGIFIVVIAPISLLLTFMSVQSSDWRELKVLIFNSTRTNPTVHFYAHLSFSFPSSFFMSYIAADQPEASFYVAVILGRETDKQIEIDIERK